MAEYIFSPQLLPGLKRQSIKQFLLIVIPFGFCYSYIIRRYNFIFSLLIALLGISALSLGLVPASKRLQQSIQSYRLVIDQTTITSTQLNAPFLQIPTSNINNVIEDEQGKIIIQTANKHQSISIIPQISNREKLIEELKLFTQNFTFKERTLTEKLAPFATAIATAILLSLYLLIKLFST